MNFQKHKRNTYMKLRFQFFPIVLLCLFIFSCKDSDVAESFAHAEKNAGSWCYVRIPNMKCRSGKKTGIGIKINNNSNKLLIYLEGGGACFNDPTCLANPDRWGKAKFSTWKNSGLQLGVFNDGNENNPFHDWNMVYVPYCTGDIHSGTNFEADVGIRKKQRMVGYRNMSRTLEELVAYFGLEKYDEIFLTGTSAGGYGAIVNASQTADAFPNAQLTVLSDSGPVLLTQVSQPDCLDEHWENTFGMHVPDDFSSYVNGGYTTNTKSIYEYLANKYPQVNFGLATYNRDLIIREFYGYGKDNCDKLGGIPPPLEDNIFQAALQHLRDEELSNYDNWSTYYIDGIEHTINNWNASFNSLEVDNVRYRDWINDLRQGEAEDIGN